MKNKSRIFVALLLFFSLHAYTQNTNPRWSIAGNTVAEAGIGNRLGTMTLGIPLNIYAGGTQRAIFNGTTGFLGVGTLTPAFQLDIQDNINVNTANAFGRGYWVDGFLVLQVPALENTFVGKGSGANFAGPLGANTFVGFQAGGSMVGGTNNGDRNTFVGRAAGYAMINGRWNTFIGTDAGLNMVSGNSNTFVGEHAGFRQVSGSNNTYVGSHSEQTTITYNLPESVKKAQLLFYDATGKLIKAVDLTYRGNGQLNVFANDLSNGIYSYALVADGQIADTKRMVKTN